MRHPLYYAKLLAYRVAQTVWLYEPEWMSAPTTLSAYEREPLALVVDRPVSFVEDALNAVIMLAAALALFLTGRRWRREHAMLIVVVLATLGPYLLILVQPRYVLPAEFVYFIWIGLGVDVLGGSLLSRLRHRGPVRALRCSPRVQRTSV